MLISVPCPVEASMRLSRFLIVLIVFALCIPAQAQQPKKVPRIGYLAPGSPSAASENVKGFRKGLWELGYVEGKTIVIEYRYTERLRKNIQIEIVHALA